MRPLVSLFFLASGFSALIYQVAWVRILTVTFGTTVYAISTVLTVFMAGLALGSFLFGERIDRWGRPLLVYGVLELALAVYVALLAGGMPWIEGLTASLLRGRELSHTSTSLIKFLIAGLVLLPPTTLMGGTLPVLAKFVTRSSETVGRWLGRLYGLNTLGAVLGSLAAAYLLILRLGVSGTILFAATITALVGIISCWLALRGTVDRLAESAAGEATTMTATGATDSAAVSRGPGAGVGLLFTVAFGSGFVTLAAEVLWTRLFVNLLTSNVLVFATILGAFLTGIALGSFLVSVWIDRVRSLAAVVSISVLVSAILLGASALSQGGLGTLLQQIRGLPNVALASKVNLSLGFMFLVVALPATVFGTVLPALFRWCSRSLTTLGSDIGRLYAWNTVGAIAGSFASGFVMLPLLGLNASLLLLGLLYALLAAALAPRTPLRLAAGAVATAGLILIATPSFRKPIYWYNGGFTQITRLSPEQTLFLAEGIEGTVGVLGAGDLKALTVNGVAVAESSLHDLWDLLLKAHLPMLLHENPRRVALVGLGAGISLGAVEAYREPELIDTVEIAREVLPAHRLFAELNRRSWEDPRLRLSINDGRHFLLTTVTRYDVISVDPTDPPVVYQYTQDFMQLCHDRLAEGGIMVQWVPLFHLSSLHLKIIVQAFLNVFAESSLWYDGTSILLLGRRGLPLEIDISRLRSRLRQPHVESSLATIGSPDEWRLLSTFVAGREGLERMVEGEVPENSDDRPYLEYAILRSPPVTQSDLAANLAMFEPHWQSVTPLLRSEDRTPESLSRLAREEFIMRRLLRARILKLRGQERLWENDVRSMAQTLSMSEQELRSLWPFYR